MCITTEIVRRVAFGRLAALADPADNSVSLSYNSLDLVTAIAAPAGRSASFSCDAAGRFVQESDFHGRVSSLGYDANTRSSTLTRPDASTVTSQRDPNGNITATTSTSQFRRLGLTIVALQTGSGDELARVRGH